MGSIRSDPQPGQHLHVGPKQPAGEIVLDGIDLAAPPAGQARPGTDRVFLAANQCLIRQGGGTMLRGEAEQLTETAYESAHVLLQPAAEGMVGVKDPDGCRQPALRPMEAGGEPKRLGDGH